MGMVRIHAHIRLTVTPQRTAERRLVAPTPIIEPVMVCVVLTGIPRDSVRYSVIAPAVSAATPSRGVTLVMRDPIVLTIFQPPLMVPRPIAAKQEKGTQFGTSLMVAILPCATRAAAMIPITFCASFPP